MKDDFQGESMQKQGIDRSEWRIGGDGVPDPKKQEVKLTEPERAKIAQGEFAQFRFGQDSD